VDHVHRAAQRRKTSSSSVPAWFTPETILEGTHVYRVHDEAALTATIHTLPDFLQEREEAGSPVRLVIVDSIAFHYRCDTADYMARTRSLTSLAAFLADLANNHSVAVVVVNQMTTKIGAQGEFKYVPALGESWAHATTTRLLLSSATHADDPSVRQCTLLKSPHKATGTALFQVRECGVRDPPLQDASKRQRQG
jgi:RAD51-like protein 2